MKKLSCTSCKGASYATDFKTRVGWHADRCASIKATSIDALCTGMTQGTCGGLKAGSAWSPVPITAISAQPLHLLSAHQLFAPLPLRILR
jgi:hypothetical protein